MATKLKEVTLACREGSADKVYQIWIEPEDDGFMVKALYGRRGGSMASATKTSSPVPKEKAEKVYDGVLKEKFGKGYTVFGEAAPAYTHVDGAVDTGRRVMLLTDCTESGPDRFVAADEWCGQEKMNGKRIVLHVENGKVVGSNRRGLECGIPEVLIKELAGLKFKATLDGELIGENYHAFDAMAVVGDLREVRFGKRHDALLENFHDKFEHVKVVPRVFGKKDKQRLVDDLQKRRKEGVVFKLLGGLYVPGKVENEAKAHCVKVKFYAEALLKILHLNDKQSIEVAAFDDKAKKAGAWVSVGNVTVATKFLAQVRQGGMVRVRYLYATDANRLYQPNLDPTADGVVVADDVVAANATRVHELKHEGKEE